MIADLADKLWLSVHTREEVDAAWDAEIAHRIRQIDTGEVECVPWETVLAELRGGKLMTHSIGARLNMAVAWPLVCCVDLIWRARCWCVSPVWAHPLPTAPAHCR